MSIFLGNINPGHVASHMASSLAVAVGEGAIHSFWLKPSPPYLDVHRNLVVERFMEGTCDRLLFVDSDNSFTVDDVRLLEKADLPVISGWYINAFEDGVKPVVYGWGEQEEGLYATLQFPDKESLEDLPECAPRIAQVTAAGAGMLMIHREVIEAFYEAYGKNPLCPFAEQIVRQPDDTKASWYGEDLLFGMRASQLGYPWHLHKDVLVPHWKTVMLR